MSIIKCTLLLLAIVVFIAAGCSNKNNDPLTVPQVSTTPVTNITPASARSGGVISTNGGGIITASGICWSKTNHLPDITNDTTKGSSTSGTFIGNMINLSPGTTYYVRAYAINNVGPGYGDVVNFSTSNNSPEARNITIAGTAKVAKPIIARYTYFDAENDPQNGTGFQWYIANDTIGATVTPIGNATDSVYTLAVGDQNRFLKVHIIPRSSTGTSPGIEAKSSWIGPVGAADPTSLTFTYNGQAVTYGIITSAVTGRKWLDRNLGAPDAPGAFDDWQNKGDLFQWGRKADGHQLINRAATTSGTTGVNGTTAVLSTSDNPGHALFITNLAAPFDWRNPQNANLWQVTGGTNNACPVGWHIPSKAEWEAENLGTVQDAYTKLKITTGGTRNFNNGSISITVNDGLYWTSTVFNGVSLTPYSFNFSSLAGPAYSSTGNVNANGLSVRCIKD